MKWAEYFQQDLDCQLIASAAGFGPKVFYSNAVEGVTAMEYVPPEDFPSTSLKLHALVDLLKKIHTGPSMPKGINRAIDLDESIEIIQSINPKLLDLTAIREIKNTVTSLLSANASFVPCHRDLHSGNLIYTQEHFVAIDYTWSGMDDPYVDLATLAIFQCKTPGEKNLLLQLYFDQSPTPKKIARLSLMEALVKIFYSLEFLQIAPLDTLKNKDMQLIASKNYLNFGCNPQVLLDSNDYLEYAASMLCEVINYSNSEQYRKDLSLL